MQGLTYCQAGESGAPIATWCKTGQVVMCWPMKHRGRNTVVQRMTEGTTCKHWRCEREPGAQDEYDSDTFCSLQCAIKYEHIVSDARDAAQSAREEAKRERGETYYMAKRDRL